MTCSKVGSLVLFLCAVGAINWGLVGAFHYNLVTALLGSGRKASAVYILIGIAGLMKILSCFIACPCKKKCDSSPEQAKS